MMAAMVHRRKVLVRLGQVTIGLALTPACKPTVAPAPPQPIPPAPTQTGATMPQPTAALFVDLTHDVICPWCRIGHHNLRTALGNWQGAPVEVRLHPYLLDPSVPSEGVDLRARLAERYGAAQLDAMFARVTQVGAGYGIKFDFNKIRRTPDTTLAHALILAAPAATQSDLLDAIHRAYFEQGADIGAAAVLQAAWLEVGLPLTQAVDAMADAGARAQVRQLAETASKKGLNGVPHFELHGPGGNVVLQGGQAPDAIRAALRHAAG